MMENKKTKERIKRNFKIDKSLQKFQGRKNGEVIKDKQKRRCCASLEYD